MNRPVPQPFGVPVLCLVVASGCGDPLATGSYRPPYLTLSGRITAADVSTPPDVRIALLWQADHTGVQSYAEQLVSVRAEFPVRFELGLTALPPAEVVHAVPSSTSFPDVDPALQWAVGTLVVYADGNGNGRLDVVPTSDATSPDTVLGAAEDLDVFYLVAGQPAPAEWVGLLPVAPGFSLVREPPPRDPRPGECGRFTVDGHLTELCSQMTDTLPVPVDPRDPIELTLVDDPALQRYACGTFWGPHDYADWALARPDEICDGPECRFCRGYQCPLDVPPAGVPVTCNTDGTAYVYKTCSSDASWCGTRFCHFGHGERMAGDPAPAGWPCP